MTSVNPSMRLKVKGDTYYVPDPDGRVYFQNNLGSFQMEGKGIDKWIEKLMPLFNGEHTLEELTNGLSDQRRDHIYQIADMLYQNGFVHDWSSQLSHQLSKEIMEKYAPQIEFLNSFTDSAAYRFQLYRQTKVLAVGSGSLLSALVAALLESGLPAIYIATTHSTRTNRERLWELAAHARKEDSEVKLEEIYLQKNDRDGWQKAVQAFQVVLYVQKEGDLEELRVLYSICKEQNKIFIPAICQDQVGIAGPVLRPDADGCFESARRRIHRSSFNNGSCFSAYSPICAAMLANIVVFELLKTITGTSAQENKIFLMNLETMEGEWHPFTPHPLVTGGARVKWVQDTNLLFEQRTHQNGSYDLPAFFGSLTSDQTGIFHTWDEGDLEQLPLAQCRVAVVDPLSEGPVELLADIVCSALTHDGARREAGLAGIEAYASRMAKPLLGTEEFVGIGAGETVPEAVTRGLQKSLTAELRKQLENHQTAVYPVELNSIEDKHSLFYLQALTIMNGPPTVCLGEEISGFPVVWIGTNDRWYYSACLHLTMGLRTALQQALWVNHNPSLSQTTTYGINPSSIVVKEKLPHSLVIPTVEEAAHSEMLKAALSSLRRNNKELFVCELELEQVFKEELAGVFGVLLRKDES
ncbi:putative thiazole-containing bacteriocin maturation protein [Brevibacillus fortis]|uniref:Putative thiazole-containing bacteriocin maturation protein n=1 Tax=Brevibacillus fortis TaxID=2126352 RepID=A0A2P7UID2_9BACL|nr:putative thiazole-containing bacteriocin maturation protein [Brevibacillus fortis]MED1785483.1 putative thiazole-containing bacteriocin maturation protein [Brevibacillus fortis]PSJ86781.1 putative thiazole-containing bacteriocin maturation protein [Brevibacillus fortis]